MSEDFFVPTCWEKVLNLMGYDRIEIKQLAESATEMQE